MRRLDVVENALLAEALVDVLEFGHQFARALAGIDGEPDRSEALAPRGAFLAQMFQAFDAALVARAPGLDALADPDFFLRPELFEAAVGEILGRVDVGLALLVHRVVAREDAQPPAIELRDLRDDAVEEAPIVRDHHAGQVLLQQLLEDLDAVDVEMVGRLVEQQQFGIERERQRQRRALAFAARHLRRRGVGIHREAVQELRQPRLDGMAVALVGDGVNLAALQQRLAHRERRRATPAPAPPAPRAARACAAPRHRRAQCCRRAHLTTMTCRCRCAR